MPRKTFILFFLLLSAGIGILQIVAVRFSLYYALPWLDVLMHVLGGAWIASIAFVLASLLIKEEGFLRGYLLLSFLSALFIAISWERLELYFDLNQIPGSLYWPDTLADVGLGIVGSLFAALLIVHHFEPKT